MKFKHFYDAGTIGAGTIKFRHYSQTEPSTGETWVLNETLNNQSYGIESITFSSNNTTYTKFARYYKTDMLGEIEQDYVAFYTSDTNYITVYDKGTWTDQAYRTITFATAPTGDLLTWLQANGTKQGGGGAVIKAGTYKWVDTPNIQGIVDIIGEDGGFDGQFKSSDITFDSFTFSTGNGSIYYYPPENFASLIGGKDVNVCGYVYEQWGVQERYKEVTVVPSMQTFSILTDIDLSDWDDMAQQILTWFTANTTKLS